MDGFVNVTAFTILAALWLAFAVTLIGSRSSLDATWRGVGALPLPVKGVVWLLTLPVMVGLAVWEGAWRTRSWPVIVRLRRDQEATRARRTNERRWPAMTTTTLTAHTTRGGGFGRFTLHFFEMCAPMCVGFVIGDLIYFWAAGKFGYSEPFKELPELSVVVVTFTMTAPMVAWMVYRGMPRRPIAEMAAVMPVLGAGLLVLGWLSVLPMGDLALWEHGLMMPAMLVPMFLRLDLYTSKHSHQHGAARAPRRAARDAHVR